MPTRTLLQAQPNPARDYAEAVARFEALQNRDDAAVDPVCQSTLLSHGGQTEKAVVCFHGYTSCPRQFHQFGTLLFERGFNVILPRMPFHGLRDRLSTAQARLTARHMVEMVDQTVDIVDGLGRQVYVVGLSMGGMMAGWAAQHRADADRVLIIAPAFGLLGAAPYLRPALALAAAWLPPMMRWFDPVLQADALRSPYDYPLFSGRAAANLLRLGFAVQWAARRKRPAADSIAVVTNDADLVVDNQVTANIVAWWRRHGHPHLHSYEFPANLNLSHDLISPHTPGQQVERVYPLLMRLLEA